MVVAMQRPTVISTSSVASKAKEMVRLQGALDPLRVAADVVALQRAYVEEWGDVPGAMLNDALTEGCVLAEHDLHDLAARFARKARSDEIALEKLADDPDVPDDLIGFHAQPALEKYPDRAFGFELRAWAEQIDAERGLAVRGCRRRRAVRWWSRRSARCRPAGDRSPGGGSHGLEGVGTDVRGSMRSVCDGSCPRRSWCISPARIAVASQACARAETVPDRSARDRRRCRYEDQLVLVAPGLSRITGGLRCRVRATGESACGDRCRVRVGVQSDFDRGSSPLTGVCWNLPEAGFALNRERLAPSR